MKDMACLSAVKLVKAIKEKRISSFELLEFYIERYGRLNPKINAIVTVDFENAGKRARAADKALAAGKDWGPLHGLPMTLKDNIDVAGMPTSNGFPQFKDFIPGNNSDTAQSLLDAGAIIFGKTNLPLFAMDYQSFNDVYGQTNNPWDVTKTPGGSSGGAAAALAGGLTGLEIGNDIGGSIRIPAHFCGVYGHKPSYNIVSMNSRNNPWKLIAPDFPDTNYLFSSDIAVQGPLARSAEDLKLAMSIITGPPFYQKKAFRIELPPPRKARLKEFRIGLWIDDKDYPPDSETGKCLQEMVEALEKKGIIVTRKKPDIDFVRNHRLHSDLVTMTLSHTQPPEIFNKAVDEVKSLSNEDQSSRARYLRAATALHRDWLLLNIERAVIRQKWEDYFQEFDVLLCPVERITAFPHDHKDITQRVLKFNGRDLEFLEVMGPWCSLSLVPYLPATVAPIGFTTAGLPVGVQIIGPYLEDYTTIEFARLLEKENISSFKLPPGFE